MSEGNFTHILLAELDRLAAAGRSAKFWLRDDDAVEPTPALEKLLAITGATTVPVTLAIIPAFTGEDLTQRLADATHVNVAVHGWSHKSYAADGEKNQELGAHRPAAVVLGELEAGLARLAAFYPRCLTPVLVPPWNRIDAGLLAELPAIGFRAVSVYGPEKPAPIRQINTHVDLIDWRGTRGGRDPIELATEMATFLRADPERPMGLLSHHLVHDNAAWEFLEMLLRIDHPALQWVSLPQMLANEFVRKPRVT